MSYNLKLFYVSAECKPYSKVGGVGDVAGELPWAIREEGVDIEIVTPLYESALLGDLVLRQTETYIFSFEGKKEIATVYSGQKQGIMLHFIKNETFFEKAYSTPYIFSPDIPFLDDVQRFAFFSEACLYLIQDRKPDLVHMNEWVMGFLAGRLVQENFPQKRVFTIHNIGYQGNIGIETIHEKEVGKLYRDQFIGPWFLDPRPEWKSVNPLRLGLETAHQVNTVSPGYCEEILEPEDQSRFFQGAKGLQEITNRIYAKGLLKGILNGYNYQSSPTEENFKYTLLKKAESKRFISLYFQDPNAFLIGFVGRAVEQKMKLLTEVSKEKTVLDHILDIPGVNLAIVATGQYEYESFLKQFSDRKNCLVIIDYDKEMAGQVSLGSDIFLMPSLYEPCGIAQMDSLAKATPPLVRWTGGLKDTVKPHYTKEGTGFGFDGSTRERVLENLVISVKEAINVYNHNQDTFMAIQRNAFKERFLWSKSAKKYIEELYLPAMQTR